MGVTGCPLDIIRRAEGSDKGWGVTSAGCGKRGVVVCVMIKFFIYIPLSVLVKVGFTYPVPLNSSSVKNEGGTYAITVCFLIKLCSSFIISYHCSAGTHTGSSFK